MTTLLDWGHYKDQFMCRVPRTRVKHDLNPFHRGHLGSILLKSANATGPIILFDSG